VSYIVRQANLSDDKNAFLKFWREHGAKPIDNKFRWIYENNPCGEAVLWLLIDEGNQEIVGCAALFPREVVVDGEAYRAGIAGDLLIHKNHRTMGPALMLMREVFKSAGSFGFDLIYTLPNKNADLLAKRVGYKKIATLDRYVNLFKVKQQLIKLGIPYVASSIFSPVLGMVLWTKQRKLWRCKSSSFKFSELTEFDEKFLTLWKEYSLSYPVLPDRSIDYMNWKYFSDPDDVNHAYAAFSLDKKEMLGCVVYCNDGSSIEIRELILSKNNKSHKYIITEFLRHIQKSGKESAVMNVAGDSRLSAILVDFGFTLRSSGRNVRYACFNDNINQSTLDDKNNWYFVMSDEDT
jgi:GNAT superfamily N-acetyltransferase